ncbi:hypothetical protein Riv7116_4762 [Rivularia sp. PCC 7116]|uniref:acyltransferase n=1 Tax=Rivularia sp. PCC 7116 TaxID=373994 RepID=UPI00029F3C4F|nr:acyltransferase [Rivularia sp. PCC 7116]AFY57175.1 hypothetical protein Riv7116_4762 [Rivularia sp. PCC 7116]
MQQQTKNTLSSQTSERIFFLELLKAISIIAVVSFHAIFIPRSTFLNSSETLETLFAPLRFCVPVLLTVSLVLFERQISDSPADSEKPLFKKRLHRLGIPILFWFSIATALKLINGNSILEVIAAIFQGEIFTGAYYFIVLIQVLWNFVLMREWLYKQQQNIFNLIIIQAILLLFVYATIGGFFVNPVLQLLLFLERPFIIYWLGYIALGVYIYQNFDWIERTSYSLTKTHKILILCFTAATMMAEYQVLSSMVTGTLRPFDYAAFSCILSVPMMFICFASVNENSLPIPVVKIVKILSKYSLGIFCINGILAQIFLSIGTQLFSETSFNLIQMILIKIISWIVLFVMSLLLSIFLERLGLKKIVC